MDRGSGEFCQDAIANDVHVLGRGGHATQPQDQRPTPFVHYASRSKRNVLAVVHHGQIKSARILHRASHDTGVRHRTTVIRNGHNAGALHLAHLGQFFSLAPFRDRSDWKNVGELRALSLFDDEARDGRVIVYRIGVGHGADGSPTTSHRRRRARGNRLLVLGPRLAQMHVKIDKSRRYDEARCVEDFCSGRQFLTALQQPGNASVFNQEISTAGIYSLRRIDHVAIGDYEFHVWRLQKSQSTGLTEFTRC